MKILPNTDDYINSPSRDEAKRWLTERAHDHGSRGQEKPDTCSNSPIDVSITSTCLPDTSIAVSPIDIPATLEALHVGHSKPPASEGDSGACSITPLDHVGEDEVTDTLADRMENYRFFTASLEAKAALGNTPDITQPPVVKPRFIKDSGKWGLQRISQGLLGWQRLGKCYRTPFSSKVRIMQSPGGGKAHYQGLVTCGSVWVCPVCSSKITERRKQELTYALAVAKELGLQAHMLTLTIRHNNSDLLSDLMLKFGNARRTMLNRKTWKAWKAQIHFKGSIRSLEVTHGENGWHVHTHEIIFTRPGGKEPLASDVLPMWQKACFAADLPMPNHHGVDIVQGDEKAGEYVSKWGMDAELTKSMSKKGREGRRSPWDLLRAYGEDGDETAGRLFREYAENFKGRKQLMWSEGLRKLLGLGVELTDEEIAEEVEESSEVIGELTRKQWRVILEHDVRGRVLDLATYGMEWVSELLVDLEKRLPGTT